MPSARRLRSIAESARRIAPAPTYRTLRFQRAYADHPGATAQSKDFAQRERSEETRYMREKEAEDIKKFKAELEQHKKKLAEIEDSLNKRSDSLKSPK